MRYKIEAQPDTLPRDALEFLPLDMAVEHLAAQNIDKKTKAILMALLKRIG